MLPATNKMAWGDSVSLITHADVHASLITHADVHASLITHADDHASDISNTDPHRTATVIFKPGGY